MRLSMNIENAYYNINQNIQYVLSNEKLDFEDKKRIMNLIDDAVYKTIDDNVEEEE